MPDNLCPFPSHFSAMREALAALEHANANARQGTSYARPIEALRAALLDGARWRVEFPDFPPEGMPRIPPAWRDESWHNDACPFFVVSPSLGLFIDYPDAAQSEFPTSRASGELLQFQFVPLVDGQHTGDAGPPSLFASDCWPDVLTYAESPCAIVAHALADGFSQWHTGGGCYALSLEYDGAQVLITDNEGCGLPDGDSWLAGVHDDDGNQVAYEYGEGLDSLKTTLAAFKDKAETLQMEKAARARGEPI